MFSASHHQRLLMWRQQAQSSDVRTIVGNVRKHMRGKSTLRVARKVLLLNAGIAIYLILSWMRHFIYESFAMPTLTVPEWFGSGIRWPTQIAAVTLAMMGSFDVAALRMMSVLQQFINETGLRMKRSLKAHLLISISGTVIYSSYCICQRHILAPGDDSSPHLLLHNFHWTFSCPLQWYVFSQCYTRASQSDMLDVYMYCFAFHIAGILHMLALDVSLQCVLFVLAVISYVCMLWKVFCLPLIPEGVQVARRVQIWTTCLWSAYPVVKVSAMTGLIGIWSEQVFAYSMLDIVAKALTLSSIMISRCVLTLADTRGTLELTKASLDLVFVVDDSFRMLEALYCTTPASKSLSQMLEVKTMLQLCINSEHQDRLMNAARKADAQAVGLPPPRCIVAFKLPCDQGELLCQCHTSQCVQNRRTVGVQVESISNGNSTHADQSDDFGSSSEDRDDDLLSLESGSRTGDIVDEPTRNPQINMRSSCSMNSSMCSGQRPMDPHQGSTCSTLPNIV
eukprot:gnl/TRDRNA2_/TRDRNA2_88506_c0_seq1.p1 gnl/TRDRNA2_/TRDRNA2_88506_c0~~gnl/TRDRNA2_/TRDRNA2_88506_c0_seq1.p1  ORF type:complete len:508 (-),score=70.93 gnl/TRDRNA2_/TRDRNA2_88506_c0_seq1:220-1743(-)